MISKVEFRFVPLALALMFGAVHARLGEKQILEKGGVARISIYKLGRMSGKGRVSRTHRLSTTVQNCTRDEGGGPFEVGSQVQVSSHRKLLSSRAMVVSVAETSGSDPGRQG